ncbi:MAG: type II toxin-antitoxin system mRNA interferase toxin, RelE/StbE family [Leptolyngbya sp. ERB_1_1]
MRELTTTPKFKRAFRKFARRNAKLQRQIEQTLIQMQADLYDPSLGTHSLSGKLEGLKACSCGYDCRIVFSIEKDAETETEYILLLDIGTHNDVY